MAGSKTRMTLTDDEDPVRRPRRSERLSGIANNDCSGSGAPYLTSAPQQGHKFKRKSSLGQKPISSLHRVCPKRMWSQMNVDLLSRVVNKLPPWSVARMRLVCKAWHNAVANGLQTLRSDNIWTTKEIGIAARAFPGLASLDLQNCSKMMDGLASLRHMQQLQHLRMASLTMPASDCFGTIRRLKQLVTLSLPQCPTIKLLWLNDFSKLQRLDLTGSFLLEDIVVTRTLPHLTCMSLRECRNITEWTFLKHMPSLKSLDLAYCLGFSNNSLRELAGGCHALQMLVLLHCRGINDQGMPFLVFLKQLKDVYLDGCSFVSEACMQALSSHRPDMNLIRFSL